MLAVRRQVCRVSAPPPLRTGPTEKALHHPQVNPVDTHGVRKRIFLVDRHPLVREWLAHVLSQESDVMVCGHAADASAAMRGIAALGPHAIIMDLTLEDGPGPEVIDHIISRSPNTVVLVLSAHDEANYAARLLQAGVRGCISKTEPTRKIIAALRCVLQGRVYLGPATAQSLIGGRATRLIARGPPSIETLSDRELEVFAMTGRGLGTRHIADILHLSPKTIQAYHGRIKDKLRLCDATELMREAICWVERAGNRTRRTNRPPDDDGTADVGDAAWLR
jgi:DNA-binding NarL/FixJ family response regulator